MDVEQTIEMIQTDSLPPVLYMAADDYYYITKLGARERFLYFFPTILLITFGDFRTYGVTTFDPSGQTVHIDKIE